MNLLDSIREAGIIGAGGAGFPTHVKLSAKADYILLNGAECEPLLRVDQQLMAKYPEEIIKGLVAAGKEAGAKKAIIGIKLKHAKVIAGLIDKIQEMKLADFVEIKELPDVYPSGDEQVLVYELTGRVVPEAGIPIQVGCIVINAETALNIENAVKGRPVTETYVTVAGDIPNRVSLKVPIGTPVIDVLKLSGIEDFSDYRVISGGPMMGPVLADIDGYIEKKNKGFVILKKDHSLIRKKTMTKEQARKINRATCEQCRMCTDMCPRYLLGHNMQPHKMMRILNYGIPDDEGKKAAQLCCQCNLCELFSCPIGLFPKMANMYLKDELLANNIRYKSNKEQFETRNPRKYRQLPSKRLIARLGLTKYDKPAPMIEVHIEPEMISISTGQHVGAPATPLVKQGDPVVIGQKIGEIPGESLGAAIHASIDGIVERVERNFITIRRKGNVSSNRNG